jgi:hypothetical protein
VSRVLLGIASGGSPSKPFLESLAALELPPSVEQFDRSVVFGNYIPGQRELIMTDAIEGGYDELFFVDDDIVLPPDALTKLLETAGADPRTAVVGGLYYSRDSARPIAVAGWQSSDTSTAFIPPFTSTSTDSVDGIGFGCALLRVAVARSFTPPYFPAHVYMQRSSRTVRQCDEDFRYCERVREAGFVVRLDARVRCRHYDRARDVATPVAWEDDAATCRERMIVAVDGGTSLVARDDTLPRVTEHHAAADLVYITVDG